MPPRKTPLQSWIQLAKDIDGMTAYRVIVLFGILSITPFASILPHIENFKPLWLQVEDFRQNQTINAGKIDNLDTQVKTLTTTTDDLQKRFGRFEVDFEKYKTVQATQSK